MSLREAMWEPTEAALDADLVPVLIGPPGIGKTAGLVDVCAARNWQLITVILSTREPSDIAGLPVVSGETKQVGNKQVPVVSIAPPDWAVDAINCVANGYNGALIFFDEYNTAPPSVQAATLRIINERDVNGLVLPRSTVHMAMAMNPVGQAAGGWDLAMSTRSRIVHINVEATDVDGLEFARDFTPYWGCPPSIGPRGREVPEEVWLKRREQVAAFLQQKPSAAMVLPRDVYTVTGSFPCPRTWDFVSRALAAMDLRATPPSKDLIKRVILGCIGEGMAEEFLDFISSAKLPTPEEILRSPLLLRENWPSRQDKIANVASGIVTVVKNNHNIVEWQAAWILVEIIRDKGSNDVAATMARELANFWAVSGSRYGLSSPPIETLRKLGIR